MATNENKRIVISGTYGTGKTTITNVLSNRTGIPKAVARGMREILPETFPGKKLEECNPSELLQLGIIRYGERVSLEKAVRSGFISDGSAIHEWAYGHGREIEGSMGRGTELTSPEYSFGMNTFGEIVKRHAKQNYTHVVHLPVEFPLPQDGHRPVSEKFRHKADEILLDAWKELGFNPIIIGGTVNERLEKIISTLDLDVSSTINGGRNQEGVIYFDKMEDILGDTSTRYFSNGFRNTKHTIRDVAINLAEKQVTAKADLSYVNGEWAMKDGKKCTPHFSSIDSILIAGQLAQAFMYTEAGVTRDQTKNMWLRDLEIRTGKKPIEDCMGVPITARVDTKYIGKGNKRMHLGSIEADIGENGFKLIGRVVYELPEPVKQLVLD